MHITMIGSFTRSVIRVFIPTCSLCLEQHPGVVVLHDFYLSDVIAFLELGRIEQIWTRALFDAHGYEAVKERFIS